MIEPFSYHRPGELDDALELLDRYGDDAVMYMGGTELVLVMKVGLAAPEHLVDGKGLRDLRGINRVDDTLVIGAGVTHREIEASPLVGELLPALGELASQVANVRVRNVGTIGGNLCFAEPHSDPATLLIALGATAELASVRGVRWVAVEQLFVGPLMTVLEPDEIMVRLHVPLPASGTHIAYRRLAFRERSVANVGVAIGPDLLSVAIGAVEGTPRRVAEVEASLAADPADIDAAVDALRSAVEPRDSLDASAEFKRHLAGILLQQAITTTLVA